MVFGSRYGEQIAVVNEQEEHRMTSRRRCRSKGVSGGVELISAEGGLLRAPLRKQGKKTEEEMNVQPVNRVNQSAKTMYGESIVPTELFYRWMKGPGPLGELLKHHSPL